MNLKVEVELSKNISISNEENNKIRIKMPENEIPMKVFWNRLKEQIRFIKNSNLESDLNEVIANDDQSSLKRVAEWIEKIYNNQKIADDNNVQELPENKSGEQEKQSPQNHDEIKTETSTNPSDKNDRILALIISDLQTAIEKSAYQGWESDFEKLDEIAKLHCSENPSPNDEAIEKLMAWGSNFYASELGTKENVWSIFKEKMSNSINIIILDSVGVPFNSEDHLNIRGSSNEVSRIIKPGYKVAAWTNNGGKVLRKASVIT